MACSDAALQRCNNVVSLARARNHAYKYSGLDGISPTMSPMFKPVLLGMVWWIETSVSNAPYIQITMGGTVADNITRL